MTVSFSPRPTETEVSREFWIKSTCAFLADPLPNDCWAELFVRFIVRSGLFGALLQKIAFFQVGISGAFSRCASPLFPGYAPLVQGCEE